MVQQNQYGGLPHKDPNVHLETFLEIADTVKMNGVTEDVIRMRLFPFSLRDKARGMVIITTARQYQHLGGISPTILIKVLSTLKDFSTEGRNCSV